MIWDLVQHRWRYATLLVAVAGIFAALGASDDWPWRSAAWDFAVALALAAPLVVLLASDQIVYRLPWIASRLQLPVECSAEVVDNKHVLLRVTYSAAHGEQSVRGMLVGAEGSQFFEFPIALPWVRWKEPDYDFTRGVSQLLRIGSVEASSDTGKPAVLGIRAVGVSWQDVPAKLAWDMHALEYVQNQCETHWMPLEIKLVARSGRTRRVCVEVKIKIATDVEFIETERLGKMNTIHPRTVLAARIAR